MFNRHGPDPHSVMLHVIINPSQYGPETVKEMTTKAIAELRRLWAVEDGMRSSAAEIKFHVENILGKEQS